MTVFKTGEACGWSKRKLFLLLLLLLLKEPSLSNDAPRGRTGGAAVGAASVRARPGWMPEIGGGNKVGSTNTDNCEETLLPLDRRHACPTGPARGELCGCDCMGCADGACARCAKSTGPSPRGEGIPRAADEAQFPPTIFDPLDGGCWAMAATPAAAILLRLAGNPAGSLVLWPTWLGSSSATPARLTLLVTACNFDCTITSKTNDVYHTNKKASCLKGKYIFIPAG